MGAHPRPCITFRVATCYYGHPQIGVVSHVPDWASTCVQVAWPRATMGVHLSGWASNLRQLRASTHKNWASNFGGILVAHLQGLGFQLGWVWLSIVGRCGLPTWTNMVAQHGRSWASNLGGFSCPLWADVDSQHGQTWSSNMDRGGLPTWVGLDIHCGWKWTPSMDKHGGPTWTEVGFHLGWIWTSIVDRSGHPVWTNMDIQRGREWSSKMGRSGCSMWTGPGCPILPITRRPQLRLHHGCPLLDCHFVGVYGRPLLGIHPRPIIGRPHLSIVGRISGRPIWTHVGPPEWGAYVTCPRGVHLARLKPVI